MPTKVTINNGTVVINDGASFLVTNLDGSIDEKLAQGFFVNDTRLISYYEISINHTPLSLLASSTLSHHSALYEFTNRSLKTVNGDIPAGRIMLEVRRDVVDGLHEDIDITNHFTETVEFQLMLSARSDFADIFQVKAQNLLTRGQQETTWNDGVLKTDYCNGEFYRGIAIAPKCTISTTRYANGYIFFDVRLEPGEEWHTCVDFKVLIDREHVLTPAHTCHLPHTTAASRERDSFLEGTTRIKTSHPDLEQFWEQGLIDLGALRIEVNSQGERFWMPAAGIPWFVAVFGRDTLISSLQTMAVYPQFAHGAVLKLAELQATEIDDWRDAQPGKILHEIRSGELAFHKEVPHTPYYGSIDATMLWIITLSESYQWTANLDLLKRCQSSLDQALSWIDRYGDFDGDGYVEYLGRSSNGLENQGWKDSGDSMVYPDGTKVKPAIALCEVQGYVYDAWCRAADLYEILDEPNRAAQLRQKAADLYERFNRDFWIESESFYGLGLDSQKTLIESITSNAGHLLWSGLVPPERAEPFVRRLFQPDLWCGWGIRTLSAKNPAYNPISYHLGSVWPHDCSIIAAGFKRYGYDDRVNQVADGIFSAARYFEAGRIPELFAGIKRRPDGFPIPYPDACIPQAWAAGSIFFLIHSILGLSANAAQEQLFVKPHLPSWLPELELQNLTLGNAILSIHFNRTPAGETHWTVTALEGKLEVVDQRQIIR